MRNRKAAKLLDQVLSLLIPLEENQDAAAHQCDLAQNDLFEIDALTKLGGQVLAAAFMVFQGVQFYYIWLPGNEANNWGVQQRTITIG